LYLKAGKEKSDDVVSSHPQALCLSGIREALASEGAAVAADAFKTMAQVQPEVCVALSKLHIQCQQNQRVLRDHVVNNWYIQ
jgi:hypothetical protein